jgi:methionine-rich copper-binding protein CopC
MRLRIGSQRSLALNLFRVLLLPLTLAAAPAFAEPRLVTADPPAGRTVAAPAEIRLTLSEPLSARQTGAALTMTGMPGMADHPPMAMPVRTTIGADGRTLSLRPTKKLPAGQYRIDWHTAGEGGRVTGTHLFAVR